MRGERLSGRRRYRRIAERARIEGDLKRALQFVGLASVLALLAPLALAQETHIPAKAEPGVGRLQAPGSGEEFEN
jgi:hypothetical protein